MPYLAVDEIGIETMFDEMPNREGSEWVENWRDSGTGFVSLHKGTIRKLIGRDLSWKDDPVELTEEMVKPEKPDYYAGIEWVNDWAMWRAIDKDGAVFEFLDKPEPHERNEMFMDSNTENRISNEFIIGLNKDIPDWQSTLQERTTK